MVINFTIPAFLLITPQQVKQFNHISRICFTMNIPPVRIDSMFA